jgi:hypothetical protein
VNSPTPQDVEVPNPFADTDLDGITDTAEADLGTDPAKSDSDDDGLGDYPEVNGTRVRSGRAGHKVTHVYRSNPTGSNRFLALLLGVEVVAVEPIADTARRGVRHLAFRVTTAISADRLNGRTRTANVGRRRALFPGS